ncbi:MAG TPA: hypothetical protein VM925_31995 [Labilithrix sp.]|nr:hypothetical protein [Labilithrix sp.]
MCIQDDGRPPGALDRRLERQERFLPTVLLRIPPPGGFERGAGLDQVEVGPRHICGQ